MIKNKWWSSWKKITFIILVILSGTVFFSWNFVANDLYPETKEYLYCFEVSGSKIPELLETEPKLGSSIFFHETSCPKDRSDIELNARQSCSIESALRAHPTNDVFLLISSPILRPLEKTNNSLLKQLLTYPNLKVRHITVSRYLSNTPIFKVYTSGALNTSLWPIEHSSDVLRYATLYKFGGIYLDLDVIVLKSLVKLKNFAGAESDWFIGSGILGFSGDKVGREVATDCAEELARTYNATNWGYNGPGVITRVLEKRCNTVGTTKMFKSYCGGFKVYPDNFFSPISYYEPQLFFEEGHMEKVQKMLNQSYTIHVWNKITFNYVLDNRLNIPYLKYTEKYCPKVFKASNGTF